MKKMFFATLVFSSLAVASGVKVTSFRYLNTSGSLSPAAEICGELVGVTGKPEMIKVVSDPKSKSPGTYQVWTAKDGNFCSVIATFTGRAEAGFAD